MNRPETSRNTPPSRVRSRKGARTGAVYAEAVIMLPAFLILWGCILFVHSYYSRALALNQQAKSCAWQYSFTGCRTTPAACNGLNVGTNPSIIQDDSLPDSSRSLSNFRSLPIVRDVFDIVLGKDAFVRGERDVPKPRVVGDRAGRVSARQAVMCNEVPVNSRNLVQQVFCRLAPRFC